MKQKSRLTLLQRSGLWGVLMLALMAQSSAKADIGHASFHGRELAGRKTASGEVFRPDGMTAAHRSLPFGTRLKVTNLANGRSVVLRINDRGPFVRGRMIHVSHGAARALGFAHAGTTRVRIERMGATAANVFQRAATEPPKPAVGELAPMEDLPAEKPVHNPEGSGQ